MEPRTLQQTIDDMREYIQREVAGGFEAPEEIERSAVEVFSDDQDPDVLEPIAKQLTHEAVEAHRIAEEGWPAVTDCDLLDRALNELERAGIVARQDFTCCGT